MITDRHVLVVRQQRIVRPKDLSDIGRVMDTDIEVGVIADARGQVQRAIRRTMQHAHGHTFEALALRPVGVEHFGNALSQRLPRPGAKRKETIERVYCRCFDSLPRLTIEPL